MVSKPKFLVFRSAALKKVREKLKYVFYFVLLSCVGWWASCSLQSPADLGFCELGNESLYLCRLQAVTCIFGFVVSSLCQKGEKSHHPPADVCSWPVRQPKWSKCKLWEFWSSCFLGLFGFCGPEQEATVPDAPASLTGTWAAQVISKTKPETSSPSLQDQLWKVLG